MDLDGIRGRWTRKCRPDIHRGDDEDVGSKSSLSVKSSSSINSSDSGWSWDVPKEARLNPEIEYGEMIDARDGQVYKTVEICDEDKLLCQTWMAENLNYADSVNTASLKGKSWCYDNKEAYCEVTGRLYTWAAAIDSVAMANDASNPRICGNETSCKLPEVVQGICLSGWHLPSKTEWQVLFTAVGVPGSVGMMLKSQTGWIDRGNGEDAYGFSALPAGNAEYGYFSSVGYYAQFWSSSGEDSYYAYYVDFDSYDFVSLRNGDKDNAFSIRCLKNN